jgi:hypothetical protein
MGAGRAILLPGQRYLPPTVDRDFPANGIVGVGSAAASDHRMEIG